MFADVRKAKLLKTGYAFAVSAKGIFLVSTNPKLVGTSDLAKLAKSKKNPALKQIQDAVTGRPWRSAAHDRPVHRQGLVLSWAPVNNAGWSVITSVPVSEVLAPARPAQPRC